MAGHAEEQDRRLLQQQEAHGRRNGVTTTSNEALNDAYFFPFSDQLVQWSSPVNNRLLLEAGMWHHQETWGRIHLALQPDRSAGDRRDRQQPERHAWLHRS